MAGRRLFFQIYPYFLLVAALSIIAVAWSASSSFKQLHIDSLKEDLALRCALAAEPLMEHWSPGDKELPLAICSEIAKRASARFTLIDISGHVLFDSEEEPAKMGDHSSRPEFIAAMKGAPGSSVRYSATLNKNMLYVAIPVGKGGKSEAALRLAIPTTRVDEEMRGLYARLALAGFATAVAVALLSLLLSRGISHPMDEMRKSACRIAAGELDHRIPAPDTEELFELSASLNRMAEQLKCRLREITHEKNEREAILSSMSEGVIAIDSDARIISVNRAATSLLKLSGSVDERFFHEAIRNSALQDFVSELLSEAASTKEAEIEFHNEDQRLFQVKGGSLKDSSGFQIGALIVINDITRIRQLEDVRRDFVANVSHEIKTPVTAIKGSVETLLEGAMNNPVDAERFLKIIVKHAERLNALVEDVLSLASVESVDAPERLNLVDCKLKDLMETAIGLCREKADARQISFETDVKDDIVLKVDRSLLEQAIVNLVDNAIKYSVDGSKIELKGLHDANGRTLISVRDSGAGIPKEHLPRLFERFYRVDKARSRRLGGTGLGLAIVKHIVQSHNGSVSVESTPGGGSIFTITLPS